MTKPAATVRVTLQTERAAARAVHGVWEVTLACDQACGHCGSRAGAARPVELDTAQALEVAGSLARLGCREVTLIGGEAYLRDDLEAIVAALAERNVRVTMQTGGRTLTEERARSLREAGMSAVGVSVDGLAKEHDRLRGSLGSHRAAIQALDACRAVGLVTSANSQINRLNAHLLREMCAELRSHGIQAWQVQLTVPMGRAADRPEWILEPWRVVEVIDTLAALQREAFAEGKLVDGVPFAIRPGNNLGYFGPHELTLRSRPGGHEMHWQGCSAGINVVSVESDGTVKSCPSLPTAPYAAGNITETSLEDLWEHSAIMRFARDRTADELWGFCKNCYYADECRAGCSFMTHCTLGRRGNNPFCYHRVKELEARGVREELISVERAAGNPYDFGRFRIRRVALPRHAQVKT